MYEEMEPANHSGNEEVYEQDTTTETIETQAEGIDSLPQEEPKGIKVKFNKEDRYVPEEEAPNWIQKGMNYDKVSEKADRYQQMMERTAKFYGYDNHDDYIVALEQAEMDRRVQEEAEKLGVDEDVVRNYVQPLNQKLSEYEQKLRGIEEQELVRKIESDIQRLSSTYSDFSKYQDDVLNLAATRGYSLDDAYKIASYDNRMNAVKMEAQSEAIRKIQQNADSSTGSLGADSPDQASGYMSMSASDRKAMREQNRRRA